MFVLIEALQEWKKTGHKSAFQKKDEKDQNQQKFRFFTKVPD
jgi:hypothetical protein